MTLKRKPPEENVRRAKSTGSNQPGVVVSKVGRSVQYKTQAAHVLIFRLDRDRTVRDYSASP